MRDSWSSCSREKDPPTSPLVDPSTGSRSDSRLPSTTLLTVCAQLKKDYLAGVGDSFDLVVIGGDYGKGKRTNVYGAFHLACYDVDTDTYQSICKIGTGFSEEILQSHYDFLHPLELAAKKPYYDVGTGKGPDVYFEPKMVWEVLAADLSLSPIYTAAKGLVSPSLSSSQDCD